MKKIKMKLLTATVAYTAAVFALNAMSEQGLMPLSRPDIKSGDFVFVGEETELDGDLVSGDYKYAYLSDGTAEITFYDGSDTDVVIPGIIGGRPVSSIGTQAFIGIGLGNMKSVVIPEGVTKISKRAFDTCTNLTDVTLPDSLEIIDEEAFIGASLENIVIPSNVETIGASAFQDCTKLMEVTISDGVKTIGTKAFYNCKALTQIDISDSVTTVENYAFWNCLSLMKVVIPSSMTSIPTGMFYNCTKLADIIIPKSVTSIGENAFYNCKNLTIYAEAGSAAETYAKNNSINFIAEEGGNDPTTEHNWGDGTITTAATCESDGIRTYTCSLCGETKTEKITALGHTAVVDAAVQATCGSTGLTGGSHCSVCNKVLIAQTVTPKNDNHTWDAGTVIYAATCETAGKITYTCTLCKETKSEEIAAFGHTAVVDAAVEATCGSTGLTEGSHCSVCNKVLVAQTVTPKNDNHKWDAGTVMCEATCETAGKRTYTCTLCRETKSEEIAAFGHTEVIDAAVEATCSSTGLTEGSHCSVCKIILVEQKDTPKNDNHIWDNGTITNPATCETDGGKVLKCTLCGETKTEEIAAFGHTEVIDAAVEATCSSTGLTEGSHCLVCNKVLIEQKVTPKNDNHKWDDGTVKTAATCETAGEITYTCTLCKETDTKEIAALGHTEVIDAAVEATCSSTGLTEGKHCSVCNKVLIEQTVIPENDNHKWDNGTVLTAATCETAGEITYTCSLCGETKTDEIAALGHTEVIDAAVEATCSSTGLTEGKYCSVCNKVLIEQTVTPKNDNHKWDNGTVTKAATCETDGVRTFKCTLCQKATETKVIKATGHTIVTDKAVAATCASAGKTAGSHCSVCGKVLVKQQTIAKTNTHSYQTSITKATLTKDGAITKTCVICGVKQTAKIARIKSIALSKNKYTYNGKAKKPAVTVKDSRGKKIPASNYTIKYTNNKKVGTAGVVVTMKGSNYSSTLKASFKIIPAKQSIKKLTATKKGFKVTYIKKSKNEADGYQIRYATSKKGLKKARVISVKSYKTAAKTIKKLKAKKTYYVQVRTYKKVKQAFYYGNWSKAKKIKTK